MYWKYQNYAKKITQITLVPKNYADYIAPTLLIIANGLWKCVTGTVPDTASVRRQTWPQSLDLKPGTHSVKQSCRDRLGNLQIDSNLSRSVWMSWSWRDHGDATMRADLFKATNPNLYSITVTGL